MIVETLPKGKKRAARDWRKHLAQDLRHALRGEMNLASLFWAYVPVEHSVRMENNFTDLRTGAKRLRIAYSHNLRVTQGRDNWQRLGMFGNITANASSYTGVSGSATATSATSLTNSGAAFPTTGGPNGSLQGQIVVCPVAGVYGVITANTGTVLTVSRWVNMASASGAAGTTPASTAAYAILPFAGMANCIALSSSSAAPAAGDVPRTADGLYGDGTTSGTATEFSGNGLARQFCQPTFPGAGQVQFAATFTYDGTGSPPYTAAKGLMFNCAPATAGNLLALETLLSANASFNANGDNASLTWTINL